MILKCKWGHEDERSAYLPSCLDDHAPYTIDNVLQPGSNGGVRVPDVCPSQSAAHTDAGTDHNLGNGVIAQLHARPKTKPGNCDERGSLDPEPGRSQREQRPEINEIESQSGRVRARHAIGALGADGGGLGEVLRRRRARLADHVLDCAC